MWYFRLRCFTTQLCNKNGDIHVDAYSSDGNFCHLHILSMAVIKWGKTIFFAHDPYYSEAFQAHYIWPNIKINRTTANKQIIMKKHLSNSNSVVWVLWKVRYSFDILCGYSFSATQDWKFIQIRGAQFIICIMFARAPM